MTNHNHCYGGPQLSRQNLFGHGKIFFVTAKSFSSRQNHFGHGKIFFVTAKSFWPGQNLFSSRQNHFQPRQNHFCTHVTSVRKVLWELINYGGQLTHSFISSRRCFAQTVATFCEFLRISVCSVVKVSCIWFMNVFRCT